MGRGDGVWIEDGVVEGGDGGDGGGGREDLGGLEGGDGVWGESEGEEGWVNGWC